VHLLEHLLVAPDHWDDDGAPKRLKFVVTHLQVQPHLAQSPVAPLLWQDRQIPAELGKRKGFVELLRRAVGLIEQRFRVRRDGFCYCAHGTFPYSAAERISFYPAGASQNRVTAVTVGPPGKTG
jgi:hypothetical protein